MGDRAERLESWKEIAAYLRRSPRTVQRWERSSGLPVHRLLHDRLGSVYAYPSELDAWWEERRVSLGAEDVEEAPEKVDAAGSADTLGEPAPPLAAEAPPADASPAGAPPSGRRRASWWRAGTVAAAALAVAAAGWTAWSRRKAAAPRPQRLAVLPFANFTGSPEQDFLSDGLTEELTAELGRLPQLGVIARTSVMRFKKTDKGIREIGRELRVDYVLEGSVRQADRRLRVTAQLIRVADEVHVWADSFDREGGDLIGVQREIARRVAEETRLRTAAAPEPAVDPEAHLAYLRGRYHWARRTEQGFREGLHHFQQAIVKDPGWARPFTGLADTYMLMANYGFLPVGEATPKARDAAQLALRLDPDLAEAHASLGLILGSHDWDFAGAERAFRRALELNPSHAAARLWYGLLLLDLGRVEEARVQFQRGLEADPLSEGLRSQLAACDFQEGRYDRALAAERAVAEASPDQPNAWISIARVHLVTGRPDDALAAVARARELTSDHASVMGLHAYALARAGRREEARDVLERLVAATGPRKARAFDLALAATGLGERERALAWLEQMVEERHVGVRSLAGYPEFDSLRTEPRFQAVLARVGIGNRRALAAAR
ncbi:MAG TPA: tetratricopeptide repeat protein [Vicinamibacteria bacterium]